MEEYLKLLPEEIVNKILLCATHPIVDLFKKELEDELYSDFVIDPEIDWCIDDDRLFGSCYLSWNKFHKKMQAERDRDSDNASEEEDRCIECNDYRELGSCPFCGRGQW